MLIFFGKRASHTKTGILEYETCPNCGQQGQIICSVYGEYAHVFWIPIFPLGKSIYAQCQHCNTSWDISQMPPDIRKAAYLFMKNQRTSIWHFTGLILIALLLVFLFFGAQQTKKNTAEFMADPQVMDCYYIRYTDDGMYSTMRIEAIEGDTVYFAVNEYVIKGRSNIDKINIEENFDTEELYPIAKSDLNLENEEGITLDKIRRNSPAK
jgi:hypothetical protein